MKKTWLILLCCLAACLTLGACGRDPKPDEPYGIMTPTKTLYEGLDLLKLPQQAVSSDTDSVEYRVVIDDGSGMLGFTANHCTSYRAAIAAVLADAQMEAPADQRPILGGRRGHHSEHLGHLLLHLVPRSGFGGGVGSLLTYRLRLRPWRHTDSKY